MVLTLFVVVLTLFVVVLTLFVVVVREGHVVGALVAVEFTGVFGMLGKNVYIGRRWLGKETTQLGNHHGFVIQVNFTGWKSMGRGCQRCIAAHGVKGALDPRLKSEAVIEEQVR